MTEDFEIKEEQDQEQEKKLKEYQKEIMRIASGQRMLIFVVLTIIQFLISSYVLIAVTGVTLTVPASTSVIDFSDYAFLFYLIIIISAIIPVLVSLIYIGAKKDDHVLVSNTLHAAQTCLKIVKYLFIAVSVIVGLMLLLTLFSAFFRTFFYIILYALIFAFVWYVIKIYSDFLFDIERHVDAKPLTIKADPSTIIMIQWIFFALSALNIVISLFTGNAANSSGVDLEAFYQVIQPFDSISAFLGLASSLALIFVLKEVKDEFTMR